MKAPRQPTRWHVVLAATALLSGATQLQAGTEDEALAAACMGCHHKAAVKPLTNLNQLTQPLLFERLRDYRSGALAGTLMNRITRGYSIEELERIAYEIASRAELSSKKAP